MAAEVYDKAWDEFLDAYQTVKNERDVFECVIEIFIEKAAKGDKEQEKQFTKEMNELVQSLKEGS